MKNNVISIEEMREKFGMEKKKYQYRLVNGEIKIEEIHVNHSFSA